MSAEAGFRLLLARIMAWAASWGLIKDRFSFIQVNENFLLLKIDRVATTVLHVGQCQSPVR